MKQIIYLMLILFSGFTFANENVQVALKDKNDVKKTKSLYKLETKKYLKDWALIIHGGATSPFTDIRSYDWVRQTKKPSELQWGAGIGITKMFGSAFGINLDYTLGRVSGRTIEEGGFAEDRQYWKQLGFNEPVYFRTNVFHQGTINFYIDWLGLSFGYNKFIKSQIKNKPVKPRIFALYNKIGVGFWRGESNIYNASDDKTIDGSAYTRGYTNKFTEVVFPITTGMKFKVSKAFDLGLEGTFVFMNSDKLDAFNFQSTHNSFTGQTVNSLSKINRDAYLYMNVNLTYKFGRIGSQKEHVEWVNPMEMIMVYQEANKPAPPPPLLDTDQDGVLDIVDEEPNTELGAKVDTKGRTLDSDGDGCPDHKDPEPYSNPRIKIENCVNIIDTTPRIVEKIEKVIETNTIETIKETVKETVTDDTWKLTSIYFDLNKYAITPAGATELKKVALVMKKKPDLIVEVQGHTDTRGSLEYNKKLSENRVNSAINYLVKNFGISASRFKKLPLGMIDPTVKNAENESEHQVNRRVDFKPVNMKEGE
ncbi:MAG: OmpA family protein [Sphingobacteriales bacterium]|jgi:outer membrane protein OmpA-like peptidoglycan-associated protein|nr:MAG: OmpA family protein [Sphingobacteriales bacterium]